MKRLVMLLAFALVLSGVWVGDAQALGLKIAPLEYRTNLKKDERKEGFIDVSNPSSQAVSVKVSTQAFRQINNDGGLQFYDDKNLATGIKTDLKDFELGPRQAVRMYFSVDGRQLPKGDTFAAIFFTTTVKQPKNGIGQLVRVGTLLSIVNDTPGERKAEVTSVDLPLLQVDDTAKGTYTIKNTGKGGFYPRVVISSWPARKEKVVEGSLIFAGRERKNDFTYQAGFGLHRIDVAYGESKQSRWVVVVTPWSLVIMLVTMLIVGTEFLLWHRRRKTSLRHP